MVSPLLGQSQLSGLWILDTQDGSLGVHYIAFTALNILRESLVVCLLYSKLDVEAIG